MLHRFKIFLLATLLSTCGYAQDQVELSIPDIISPGGDVEVCVPVVVDTFTNITSMQFSLRWDTLVLELQRINFPQTALELSDGNVGMPENDNFGIAFNDAMLRGYDLARGTVLVEACFTTLTDNGTTPVTFDGYLPPEFGDATTLMGVPATVNPGSVTFGADVATTVLPGDTNDDGRIDHLDLLNVGLILGATGPERNPSVVAPQPQGVARWANALLSGTNYAHVDADGNGVVEADDLEVVEDNYGFGGPTPAGDTDGTRNVLSISGNAPLEAGSAGTVTVSLIDQGSGVDNGYGMAFTLNFNDNLIDGGSISVDFSNSVFGNDLLTLTEISPDNAGQLQVSFSRKDGTNVNTATGELCTIAFTPNNNGSSSDYDLALQLAGDAYVLADQSEVALSGSTATLPVMGTVSVREPAWARALSLYPNPVNVGEVITIGGDVPRIDRIQLLDVNGRTISERNGDIRSWSTMGIARGSYFLRLHAGKESVTRPVTIR